MTYAQGQTTRANRSRILGSIFAHTPRDISASSDERPELRRQPSTSSRSKAKVRPAGWRDVTTRHARETLAERICGRFFARSGSSVAGEANKPQSEFVTAGQHLQALGGEADTAPVGQQNLAAILEAAARTPGTAAAPNHANDDASVEAGLTAKAA